MRTLMSLFLILMISANLIGQENAQEPEFIGEAFILNQDQTITELEKETVQIKTRAGVSVYIAGIGKVKSKIEIAGCCSGSRLSTTKDLKIVVKAVDNRTDPLSIIQVFKLDSKKKKRLAEMASYGTFSGGSDNNLDFLKFKGSKYGESSYILTVKTIESGEYGITVKNPNNVDEKNIVVSTFGID